MKNRESQFRPVAVVTDGLWRKSLSAIRSLGKGGYDVHVMGESFFTTGFWSGFTRARITAPTAAHDAEAFGAALISHLEGLRRDSPADQPPPVLLPMEDASLLWVERNLDRLAGLCTVLLPPHESLMIAQDKGETMKIARELGLPCPRSWEPENAVRFAELALSLESGRFVVKPRTGTGSSGVVYGDRRTRDEWIAHWERFGPMLIQERVAAHGRGQGASLLFDSRGECIAAFAHERLQQYPNSGGPSTDRHGIHAPELLELSVRLMKRLSWRGIAMVEWKLDPDDQNRPKLMEINPRFWGSLELAVRSGVDFPLLYAQASGAQAGAPAPAVTMPSPYRVGLRCRWLIPGEILRYLTQPRGEREGLIGFLKGLPGSAEEWDPGDLRGFFATLVCTAALALNPSYWRYVRRG